MKVKELIARLQTMDSDSEVLVENKGELRSLKDDDVSMDRQQVTNEAYYTDDGEVFEEGVVIFTSWA